MSRPVYFVGTIGLDTAEEVFEGVGACLGDHVRQIPDGEVAGRRQWVTYQLPVLRSYGFLRPVPPNRFVPLELNPGVRQSEIRFAELGYAREARTSYSDFIAARKRGLVGPRVRMQVGMPTPFAVLKAFLTPDAFAAVEEAYTMAMLDELAEIARRIPHEDLAFQWDVAPEMIEWDAHGNAGGLLGKDGREGVLTRMKRLSETVPADVPHGYHFCYGDFNASQVEKPSTPTAMIDLYNSLSERIDRPINWVHMPIPAHADQAFFECFRALRLRPETQLYLGLVYGVGNRHAAEERIALATQVLPSFGLATRCGIARGRTSQEVRELLDLHAALAAAN
ncbi:hypothetical protein KZX46_22240 (plasmid) [Polymorphobacter sp. PAMC 29334]|uniref:hypothetical protein n=1 Tax=Polymorphobacter sp. PAMC 29334 TaxID=2862331 RepID=UPI001C788895|nr:hypothetical protein [Polymorphobacter sp. PAMC 29334]QYE37114.1 hypothetical protein KZX46_22240 [Polymorphobacter sp. PAMC 29334]